jgi:thiol-disulfide isomerase/thioredoxin
MFKQVFAAKFIFKSSTHLFGLLAIAIIAPGLLYAIERDISWTEDYEGAIQRAASTNSVVLLHFYGDNCPPCKLLDKKTFHDPALVSTMNEHLVTVKINANRRVDLAQKYKVTRWPTDVYLFSNGDEIYRGVSNADPAVYCKTIERVALRHRDWTVERNAMAKAKEKRQDKAIAARMPQAQSENSTYSGNSGRPVRTQATAWATPSNAANTNSFNENVASNPPPFQTPMPTNTRVIDNPYITQQPIIVPPARTSPNPNNLPPVVRGDQAPFSPSAVPQAPYAPQTAVPNLKSMPNTAQPISAQPINAQLVSNPQRVSNQPPNQPAPALPTDPNLSLRVDPETIGMDGFCPVTLVESLSKPGTEGWVQGRKSCAVRHRGRVYYCATEQARRLLLSDPDRYTPALSGFDIVQLCKVGNLVDGKCEFGCIQEGTNRVFLFASKANYDEFTQDVKHYSVLIDSAHPERIANELTGTQKR